MLTAAFSSFWHQIPQVRAAPAPVRKRPAPVFIGDAVQPFAGETLLLSIWRGAAEAKADENS
ncbi:MAG: hypothetical protein AAF999_05125 [Pseudomonadota bacterium]